VPSKKSTGEMNVRYCSTCSTSFDVDDEGVEGHFGLVPVAFCATCRIGVRDMAEIIWDLVPRDWAIKTVTAALEDGEDP
jgi:hypothetical protein